LFDLLWGPISTHFLEPSNWFLGYPSLAFPSLDHLGSLDTAGWNQPHYANKHPILWMSYPQSAGMPAENTKTRHCLVVDLRHWKIWKSVGVNIPNIWKKMFQTTNQIKWYCVETPKCLEAEQQKQTMMLAKLPRSRKPPTSATFWHLSRNLKQYFPINAHNDVIWS